MIQSFFLPGCEGKKLLLSMMPHLWRAMSVDGGGEGITKQNVFKREKK